MGEGCWKAVVYRQVTLKVRLNDLVVAYTKLGKTQINVG